MTDPALELVGLTKSYRKLKAVEDLSLAIAPGEFVGFIGPNGAGKSTTMGCVSGVLNPNAGQIRVGGVDVLADPIEARKRVSFVPQRLELQGYLTGQEYLEFVATVRGVPESERQAQIEPLLELTELTKARHRLVKEYSGGMARKLAISAALLGPPDLLLLDESFVGLDPESTYRIRERLEAFCKDGGAILLSSHILDMLQAICDRVVMLVDGELKLDAKMDTLRTQFEAGDPPDLTRLYLREAGKLDAVS